MKDFEIRCNESRLEKNNTLYGKFSLGPFLPGQGTTFGNALRRSLLSELSGLGITAFEIIGIMQEFSTLPGLRESVLDLSLNLKQIVLTGVLPFSTPPIGFLKVRGPAVIYAADLQLPAGVYCAAPKQYIGTLASNGVLNLKFLVSVGKGHSTQPYSLYRSLSKVKLQPWKKESMFFKNEINKNLELHRPAVKNDATLFDDEWKNSNWKAAVPKNQFRVNDKEREFSVDEIEKTRHIASSTTGASLQPFTVQKTSSHMQSSEHKKGVGVFDVESTNSPDALLQSKKRMSDTKQGAEHQDAKKVQVTIKDGRKSEVSVASPMHPTLIRELELKRQKVFNAEILNLNNTNQAEAISFEKKAPIIAHDSTFTSGAKQDHSELGWKTELTERRGFGSLEDANKVDQKDLLENGGISYINIQKQIFQRVNPHQVLPIDAVFTPVSQVNFLTQVNDRFETPRENVVLEIWTNGSIHPKRALEEAALSLVQNFDTLLKNIQQASSFDKGLRYSNSFQFFSEKNDDQLLTNAPSGAKPQKENMKKKSGLSTGKFDLANVPLDQAIYNLDIGNLDLSLETFILLKQAKITNLAHLLKNIYVKQGNLFVRVEQPFLEHDTNKLDSNKKNLSKKESAINNRDKVYSLHQEETQTKDAIFSNVCLNEKVIQELSNILSQLGIKLEVK